LLRDWVLDGDTAADLVAVEDAPAVPDTDAVAVAVLLYEGVALYDVEGVDDAPALLDTDAEVDTVEVGDATGDLVELGDA